MVIAKTCLRHMLQFCEASTPIDYHANKTRGQFLHYATRYWWEHLQRSHRACTECVSQLALTILTLEDARLRSFLLGAITFVKAEVALPLYYASVIGVPSLYRPYCCPILQMLMLREGIMAMRSTEHHAKVT